MAEVIQYNGWQIRLIRSRRKTLSLEIDAEGLKARAPMRMRESTIIEFIRHKENWIARHLGKVKPKPSKIALENGALLPFKNLLYCLEIQANSRAKVSIKNNRIILPLVNSQLQNPDSARTKLVSWYKRQALQTLNQRVDEHINQINIHKRGSVKVREYTRRWGSCSHKGDLSFNWRIILAPDEVIDYVVIHELAHLIEFNHSKKFWRIVERQMPDWKRQQSWLSDHGSELYIV